jgi:hypothetical protein
METRFYQLPAAVRVAVTVVLMFGAMFGVFELMTLDSGRGGAGSSVLTRLVMAAVVATAAGVVIVVLGEKRMRKSYGSLDRAVEYFRALRTSELPAHIEVDTWRGWLAATRQEMRWTPIFVGVFAVIAVVYAATQQWASAALFAVLTAWFAVLWWVRRRRVSRLTSAVEQRAAATHVD